MAYARSPIMQRIGTRVSLRLYEANIVSMLLYGSETWTLDAKETSLIERVDLWALKKLFGFPPTPPTPAIRYITGTLFVEIQIKKKQLIYLQQLMQKDSSQMIKDSLLTLKENNTGWAKYVEKTLQQWNLEQQWEVIASKSRAEWASDVNQAAEEQNRTKLNDLCQKKQRGISRAKTKTKTIAEKTQRDDFKRTPLPILQNLSSLQTRALIMGRYGMLDCKTNFSMGYGGKLCVECNTDDNEAHRINECAKYRAVNKYDSTEKINFENIYSDELDDVMIVVDSILAIWDLEHGKNVVKCTRS